MGQDRTDSLAGQPGDNGVTGHLGDDVLNAYLDDALDERDRAEAATHLARCADCRQELAELRTTARLLRGLPQYRPSHWLALTPELARARRRGWVPRLLPALPALQAAAVVVALLLVVVGAGDVITHRGGASHSPAPRLSAPVAVAPSTAGTESAAATSHIMRAANPNPQADQGALATEPGPAPAVSAHETAGAVGGAAARPAATASGASAGSGVGRTGSETGAGGHAQPSRWRVAEVGLGLLLLWLIVTIVGLRRVRDRR